MKTLLILIVCCLSHILFSQKRNHLEQGKQYQNYDINLKNTSLDGKWLAFYKLYDNNSDTLVIVNRENPAIQYEKVKVIDYKWSSDRLILKYNDRTEVFDFKRNKYFDLPVCKSFGVNHNDNILALYNSDKVAVYDLKNEQLLDTIGFVSKAFFHDDTICLQVKSGNDYDLLELRKSGKVTLYKTSYDILNVKELKNHSFLIFEKKDNIIQDIVYYNGLSRKISKLSQIMEPKFNSATGYQRTDGSIIINTEKLKVKRKAEAPEIWSTSDNRFFEKFKNSKLFKFLWLPEAKKLLNLSNEKLDRVVDIGNNNYFLNFSFSEMQDYTTKYVSSKVYRFDKNTEVYDYIDTIKEGATYSPNGQFIIYKKDHYWKLVDINSFASTNIKDNNFFQAYFTHNNNNNKIIFDGSEGLYEYDIRKGILSMNYNKEKGNYKILNSIYSTNFPSYLFELTFKSRTVSERNFLFEVWDQHNLVKSIYEKKGDVYYKLVNCSESKLVYQKNDSSKNNYLFTEEDYNLPKQFIKLGRIEGKKVVYKSNIADKVQSNIRIETIQYKNNDNVDLKGTLYYPLDYNPSEKYPMVVHVYQIQSDRRNEYPVYLEQNINVGFDIRSLLENGYFVYMPDIVFGKTGTGLSALNCVHKALDALHGHHTINFDKVALIGHSHGGYITNFIATHSQRFTTYVSSAGNSDIVRSYFSLNENYVSPHYWQFESGQYDLFVPFVENKELYFRNNPIYYVENVKNPILLWTGKKDLNIEWGQVMEFYIGLKRNKKVATMLVYPEEGHFLAHENTAKDLHNRVMEWFGHYLKGEKKPDWIE